MPLNKEDLERRMEIWRRFGLRMMQSIQDLWRRKLITATAFPMVNDGGEPLTAEQQDQIEEQLASIEEESRNGHVDVGYEPPRRCSQIHLPTNESVLQEQVKPTKVLSIKDVPIGVSPKFETQGFVGQDQAVQPNIETQKN